MPEPDPLQRYQRQMLLDGIGPEGQRRLAASHAAIIGCGALGCTLADLLARAGVGALTIIDRDLVEPTNLQRQTLFDERHLAAALPKAEAARQRLAEINSTIRITAHIADLNARTLPALLPKSAPQPNVLLDGTDNFETRLLLNDLAVARSIPYIYAGVVATRGMVLPIAPWRAGPCLRCLVDHAPALGSAATCDTVGVLGAAVAHSTSLQAAEAMKVLLGRPDLLCTDLVEFDLWTNLHRRLPAAPLRDPDCPCCVHRDLAHLEGRAGAASTVLCGRASVQIAPASQPTQPLDLPALADRLRPIATVTLNAFLLRATLPDRADPGPADDATQTPAAAEPITITIFRDARVIISGTTRPERARSLYDRYLGA